MESDVAQHLRAGSNIHVPANSWNTLCIPGPDCDLLENEAVWTNLDFGMNHDAIGMGNK